MLYLQYKIRHGSLSFWNFYATLRIMYAENSAIDREGGEQNAKKKYYYVFPFVSFPVPFTVCFRRKGAQQEARKDGVRPQ